MKYFIAIIFLSFLFTEIATAQNLDKIMAKAANSFQKSGPRVGISVGVIKGGHIYTYHFGTSEKGGTAKPTNESIYEIGSITKTFTSLLLAHAVLENKVKLTDDIRKYINGDYPNLEYHGKPIQLVQLANLTSGLPDNLPEQLPPAITNAGAAGRVFKLREFYNSYTKQQFMADLHTVKLNEAPGSNTKHSNTAAQLLGFILEHIYGTSYEKLLVQYITNPLLMGNAYSISPTRQSFLLKGYNENGTLMPQIPDSVGSAGVLKSTLPDMVKYLQYQLNSKNPAVALSHQLQWGKMEDTGIGLNWFLKTNFDGYKKVWASGGTFGFASYLVFYPDRNFGFVALSNENDPGAEDALANFSKQVYNELFFTPAEHASETFGYSKSINLLIDSLNKTGFEHAIEVARHLQKSINNFYLNEDELNIFGYHLLQITKKQQALEVFKLNVNLYPQSANTYDSLAEAYANIGNKDLAIKNYQRSLELNPGNNNAAEQLKKLR